MFVFSTGANLRGGTSVRFLLLATIVLLLLGTIVVIWKGTSEKPASSHDSHEAGNQAVATETQPAKLEAVGIERSGLQSSDFPNSVTSNYDLHILVQDAGGSAIEGAEIFGVEGDAFFSFGQSDSNGAHTVVAPRKAVTQIVARAEGYQPGWVQASGALEEHVTVLLERGVALSGRLEGRSEWGLGEVIVLAGRRGQTITPRLAASVRMGDPRALWAQTASDGSFVIDGAQPGLGYEIIAAGGGLFSPEQVSAKAGDEVLVPVLPGFGGVIALVEGDGSALRLSSYVDGLGPRWGLREAHGQYIAAVNPVLSLGGVPPEFCSNENRFRTALFYCADFAGEELGPVDYSVTLPGYDRVATSLWLAAVKDQVQIQSIVLKPSTSAKGDLEIHLEGLPPSGSGVIKDMSGVAQVVFQELGENGQKFSVGIWDLQKTEQVFMNLPAGHYDLRLNLLSYFGSSPSADSPPLRVEILPDELTRVAFDMSKFGSLEISASDSEGTAVKGRSIFRVIRAEPFAEYFVGFHETPYILPCLSPGHYEISPTGVEVDGSSSKQAFSISAGSKTNLSVRIP